MRLKPKARRQMHPNATGDTKRMSLDAALRKIKACAGIAKSSNPDEAARALQQMQALMAEFKIDDLELPQHHSKLPLC